MAAELDTNPWQLNAWEINEWITFLEEKKYEDLFRYLRNKPTTRNKYKKQHSGCWDLQLFCMILYYMYKKKNRDFMDYIYKTSNNNAQNKLALGTFITSIYDIIQDRKNYLYKYIIFKQFTDDAFVYDITNISSIDDLKGYQMYPMIIYTKPQGYPKYVIFHYFTIIKSGIKYYILSSWGSDTICVLPSIAPIKKEEFSRLSSLLSGFNLDETTDEERQECMELVKKHFLVNAVPMYTNRNSVKKGSYVTPEEGVQLELNTFYTTQSYHIAHINGYNETIDRMVFDNTRSKSSSKSSSKSRSKSRSPHMNITRRKNINRSPRKN